MNNQQIEEITFYCVNAETIKTYNQHRLLTKDMLNKEYNKILLDNDIRRL